MSFSIRKQKVRRRCQRPLFLDVSPGCVYDLEKIYRDLNVRLFQGELALKIGWFGRKRSGHACRVVLGSYHREEKTIRIHYSLDNADIPLFFIEYLVYHEMVHSVVPCEYSSSGRAVVHGKKFRELERRFPMYEAARTWERAHKSILLGGS